MTDITEPYILNMFADRDKTTRLRNWAKMYQVLIEKWGESQNFRVGVVI